MRIAPSGRWLWLALAIIVADRATKYAVERFTDEGFRHAVIPGFAWLVHNLNPGMAFGIFSESASRWVSYVLIAGATAVVLFLCWLLITGRAGNVCDQAGFALIAGGAAGNLLDRLLHGGAVTDFLELHAGALEWPAFNLADSAITIGALLILYDLIRGAGKTSRAPV